MESFDPSLLKNLYTAPTDSHKGDNGKVLVIGGSKLFHAASLWALEIASKIVDMVFYSSIPENNQIVQLAKSEFRNGIVVPREKVEDYIQESDCILIGPGLPRKNGQLPGDDDTQELTESLLTKFPKKKWVVDGGSLQVIKPEILPKTAVITPHIKEFETLFGIIPTPDTVSEMAQKYSITILFKSEVDIVCDKERSIKIPGGNAGMTKGGTGDVLAGLVAAFYAKNDAFLAATAASYFNKKAGEALSKKVGNNYNSSDLVEEIPKVMKQHIV